jgi:glycosyltransferase involved in cell wall biosynthesis
MERELLRSAGHDVSIFERSNPNGTLESLGALASAPWNPLTTSSINRSIESTSFSVAHVHNTWFAISPSVFRATHRAGLPTVLTVHNYRLACINGQLLRDGQPCQVCVGTHPWAGVGYRCYRDSFLASAAAAGTLALNRRLGTWQKHVDVFIALNNFMKEILIASGVPSERIVHVPNFTADPGPRRHQPSNSDTVLFVGRLSPEKGLDQLLACWARSAPSELRLVVVGDGPMASQLARRDLRGVEFRGRLGQTEVRELMLSARVLAFPSAWYEGQPLVVLEAMSSGLGIVASNLGGLPDTIGEGGMTVRSWSDFSFRDLADVDHLGLSARKRWCDTFTPERHLEGLSEAYVQAAYWHKRRP